MFVLKCDEDGSYCMVNDKDVIFDDKTVKRGDTVQFYYNKKIYTGDVMLFSGMLFLCINSIYYFISSIWMPNL